MAAFCAARDLGADAIEFDVHLTADGHLVVVHDYDLARTTSGAGYVFESSLKYVRSLDAGSWFDPRFGDEKVPLLSEVLDLSDVRFELEVKGVPSDRLVDALISEVRNAQVQGRVEFTGSHATVMPKLREQLPDARLGLFPQQLAPWMTMHLYEEILLATAVTGGYDVVHVMPPQLLVLNRDRFVDAGLRLHAADPGTADELMVSLERGDQLTIDDVSWAVSERESFRRR
jgi:glycerophosphoryl diester phosphodiesterase